MSRLGVFLGGAAEGLESAEAARDRQRRNELLEMQGQLAARRLQLQMRQLDAKQREQATARLQKLRDSMSKQLTGAADKLRTSFTDPAAATTKFEEMFGGVDFQNQIAQNNKLFAAAGIPPVDIMAARALAGSIETPQQRGAAAGQEEVAQRAVTGPTGRLVTVKRGEQQLSVRQDDPRLDQLLAQGFSEVKTPAAVVNVGETALDKAFGPVIGKRITAVIDAGEVAARQEPALVNMAGLLATGVPTGRVQASITPLQNIAQDLGVDLEAVASRLGMTLGALSQKEDFDRLATQVMIDGFDKFKGNLNQREVEIAEGAFANLGRSEQANIEAVASAMAGAQLARERARRAVGAAVSRDTRQIRSVLEEGLEAASTTRFLEIKGRVSAEIRDRLAQQREVERQAPAIESIEDVGRATIGEIRQFVEDATPEQLLALPEDVREALMGRLRR